MVYSSDYGLIIMKEVFVRIVAAGLQVLLRHRACPCLGFFRRRLARFDSTVLRCLVLAGVLRGGLAMASDPGTVIAWGGYLDLQALHTPVPMTNGIALAARNCLVLGQDGRVTQPGAVQRPELTNIVAVASGDGHGLALRMDGAVLGWGENIHGQATPPASATNVSAVAAGGNFSLALRSNGTVVAWGYQLPGQAPTIGGLSNIVAIGAGQNHALAVKSDGMVVCWGDNTFDQCAVPVGLVDVIAVAGGNAHSLALKRDGSVVGWGGGSGNDTGQTQAPANATNVVAIAAGSLHSVALRGDGSIIGWGWNAFGQISFPQDETNFIAVSAGGETSCALTRRPVIISQPVSRTVLAGTNVSFSASALSAEPWTYQWLYMGTNLNNQSLATLQLTNVQVSHSGNYSVLVSNRSGSITSAPATLTVQPYPPAITLQPTNQTRLAGQNAHFVAAAVGAPPLLYQWQLNNGTIPGATNSSYMISNLTEFEEGTYKAIVRNAYGTSVTSTVTLTVNHPPSIMNSLTSVELPAGTNWILRAVADGNQPLAYQWRLEGTNIVGEIHASLALSNLQSTAAGQYSVVVSNAFGVITNAVATLTVVDSAPVIFTQPVSQVFLPGQTIGLRALAYGTAPLWSQWWHDGDPIPGATNTLLTLADLQSEHAGEYFITISNAFGATNSPVATLSAGDPYPGQVDWPSFGFAQVTTNTFSAPVGITHANDGSGRMFVVQQGGRIRTIQGSNVLAQPFLDISGRILTGGERGLLGMASAPGFATNGLFYVNYTRSPDGATVISRFRLTPDSNVADPNSEQIIKVIAQPYANHNGGQIAFGPDGYLYIGMGDGGNIGSTGDPLHNAQNPGSLLGKLLRIDVESGVSPYAVPTNNPFLGNSNYAPEIWALGLRNPWRFSFDRVVGDLYLGDVGHFRSEEIDFQPAGSAGGQNYGWRALEGLSAYVPVSGLDLSTLTAPVTVYDRTLGASVTGGYVYRGPNEPRMNGNYFFGDFISGRIWGLKFVGTNWQRFEIVDTTYGISTFGEDEQGRLYLADYSAGRVYQMNDSRTALRPTLSPTGGSFSNDQIVVVKSATPGATIHYTTDGREPTDLDPGVPSGSTLSIGASTALKLRAYRNDLSPSGVSSNNFSLQVAAPVFSPTSGPITNGTMIAINSATVGAVLRYTVDGSDPGPNSPVYAAPLALNGNTTLRAKAIKEGYANSSIVTVLYGWATVPTPEISPGTGIITNGTLVTINCAFPGAEIRYSTTGEPTLASSLYTGPFLIAGNSTLQARAWADTYRPSEIAMVNYDLLDYSPTVVQTYAGRGQAGYAEGAALQSEFNAPEGICVGPDGTVYVSDTGNNRIRKILPNHQVITFAGSGVSGSANGIGTNAAFSSPKGIALDASNNLYVADSRNLIRKITPSGTVSTLAAVGPDQTLWKLAVKTDGTIYAAGWMQIFQLNPDGTHAHYAGPGWCCPPDWSFEIGVALDPNGELFASVHARVVKLPTPDSYNIYAGNVGGFTDGPRLVARFGHRMDIALYPDGGWVMCDETRIRRIDTNGMVTTLAGTDQPGYQNGDGSAAAFNHLGAIAVDALGNIYVADSGNHRIRKISVDSDQDGIPDNLEGGTTPFVVGVDDRIVDSDQDGMNNTAEFQAGTDPWDADSFLAITALTIQTNDLPEVHWRSVAGKSYAVKYSDDFVSWSPLGGAMIATGSLAVVTDPTVVGSNPLRVYRVFVLTE